MQNFKSFSRRSLRLNIMMWFDEIFFFFWISDLSRNKLTELPQECTDYFSLERLVLYHNTIRSIPDSIVYLQSLQFLDLSRNQLSYLPISICELPLQVSKICYLPKLIWHFFFIEHENLFIVVSARIKNFSNRCGNLISFLLKNLIKGHSQTMIFVHV